MSPTILVLLGTGLATSAVALTLDIRAHGRRPGASLTRRSGSAVLSAMTVLAFGSLIAALAYSGFDPHGADAETPLARVLMTALALALATIGGGPFAVLALRLAARGTSRAGAHGGILITENQQAADPPPRETTPRRGLFRRRPSERPRISPAPLSTHPAEPAMGSPAVEVLRGGTTIGILERVAIAGAIVAGFPEAVAVVIAIKGVGRFSELAASEAKERFIIGTLASFVWASACALVLR
ncbi:hypothetical protein [Agreia sp.]|uniref:hypothetical protein n=1 Tax=Agreia sp. TaxID=1872416 RepID=UPI0035BC4868